MIKLSKQVRAMLIVVAIIIGLGLLVGFIVYLPNLFFGLFMIFFVWLFLYSLYRFVLEVID